MVSKFKFTVSFMVPGQGFKEVNVNAPCRAAAIETVRMHYPQAEAIELERVASRIVTK